MGRTLLSILKLLGNQARVRLALVLICSMVLCACEGITPVRENSTPLTLGAWIVDWDAACGIEEWGEHQQLFDRVHLFGAYFNNNGEIFPAPNWSCRPEKIFDLKDHTGRPLVFLTVVNDVVSSAKITQKDPNIVHRLLSAPDLRRRHIRELVALGERMEIDGIEIDYENVAETDWPGFLDFIAALNVSLSSNNIRLSVVLQPQRKYFKMPLPKGIDYTVMAYNLYGRHSGPGPKATPSFISDIARMVSNAGILETCALALATGGFEWSESGGTVGLTENKAVEIARHQRLTPVRHEPDGYLVFRHQKENGRDAEIWYADAETLRRLRQAAEMTGFRGIYIWRLGGNLPELFTMLNHEPFIGKIRRKK